MMVRLCILAALSGCTPQPTAPTVPAYCTNEHALTGRLLRCVDQTATRADYNACRAEALRVCGIVEKASAQ